MGTALSGANSASVDERKSKIDRSGEDSYTVPLPCAAHFALFACNGSIGEALNDMATDLKIRSALSSGDTTLTVSYNIAVILSMSGGFASESLSSTVGARRLFAALWGVCQFLRSFGMELLTP